MKKFITECICLKCGKHFMSSELVKMYYSEYPGAPRTSVEYASPCCNSYYDDL